MTKRVIHVTTQSRGRVCGDSSYSRVTCAQALHSGSFQRRQDHDQDRIFSREDNGMKVRHFKKSKHIELKHLWIHDVLTEGIVSLEQVGTRRNPSDVLTKFVQADVLGQDIPKSQSLQRFSFVSGFEIWSWCGEDQDNQVKEGRRHCQREDKLQSKSRTFKSISTSLQSTPQSAQCSRSYLHA